MNVARINFSHGSQEDHGRVIKAVRECAAEAGVSVSILADLQGPKVRVGQMKDDAQPVKAGDYIVLTSEEITGTSERIPIDYPNLSQDAAEGNRILVDDGLLELKIVKRENNHLVARVVVGGMIKSRKGVNLPNVNISMSSLTEKDIDDLEFAVGLGVDYIALSFVRRANDLMDITSRIRAMDSNAAVIAKIEKPEAIDAIDDIIEEAGGIMVARGDLGIEIESEKVPLNQKRIIEKCRMAGKPVITATQMLDSMIYNARPTRAESSDVANAVLDGTDAVMLSGETAIGDYPLESVQTMDKICRSIEGNSGRIFGSLEYRKPEWKAKQVVESISYTTVMLAEHVDASAISTITHSGNTARRIAKFRPKVPIIAFTESEVVYRQLALVWGVYPVLIEEIFDTDKSVRRMEKYMNDNGLINTGDRVVIATGMPIAKRGHTNMVKVSTIA